MKKQAKILIVGNGGREHAIAWKLAQSREVEHIFVAPGNGGTALEPNTTNVNISSSDYTSLIRFAIDESIDITVIGPEQPLADGIVDMFRQANLVCFGPTQEAAQLESSKVFCKHFLQTHGIATAQAEPFDNAQSALAHLVHCQYPLVIKADGLAAGKGVIIAQNELAAIAAINEICVDKRFGVAGSQLLIEQFLVGEEVSYIVLTDGKTIVPLASSQDHKKRDNGDKGPNTGGMGAYSPATLVDDDLDKRIMSEIIEPTVAGLAADGIDFQGFLYAGLMIDATGKPYVLEYNCRLGDPETQALLMRLDSDLYPLLLATANKQLQTSALQWNKQPAVCIVLAAKGYPNSYTSGEAIRYQKDIESASIKIFHAGTLLNKDDTLVSNGGRVLSVTSLGNDIATARDSSLQIAQRIDWPDKYYRTDIGAKALHTQE